MINDAVSDLLTRIRNAYYRGKVGVDVFYTNANASILEIFKSKGWISDFKVFKPEAKKYKMISIALRYEDQIPAVSHISRVSKPGYRQYIKSKDIQMVLGGLGAYIISTPRGMLPSDEARKRNLGGELICKVY